MFKRGSVSGGVFIKVVRKKVSSRLFFPQSGGRTGVNQITLTLLDLLGGSVKQPKVFAIKTLNAELAYMNCNL